MSLRVFRLVELNREPTWNLEVSDEAIAVVFDLLRKLNSSGLKLAHRLGDVIAVERNVGGAGGGLFAIGWVYPDIRFGGIENQPAITDVRSLNPNLSRRNARSSLAWDE